MKSNILLIEDEPSIADTVTYALETEGYRVTWKNLGQEGIDHFNNHKIDLIILDVGLPDMGGFEICKALRKSSDIPIIFLTARKEEVDRVVGLEIGADDYMVKPFSPRELTARVKLRLKGHKPSSPSKNTAFTLDDTAMRILYDGTALDLSRYEYRMLRLLLTHPGRIYSRDDIMDAVWESPEASQDRTVDTHIKSLRKALREAGCPNIIKTHRGMGYSIGS